MTLNFNMAHTLAVNKDCTKFDRRMNWESHIVSWESVATVLTFTIFVQEINGEFQKKNMAAMFGQ